MRLSLGQQVILIILGLIIIYGLFMTLNNVVVPRMNPYRISSQKAKSLINNNYIDLVIDVRPPSEVKQTGALPISVNIPIDSLEYVVPNTYPDRTANILIYCRKGIRANQATNKLRSLGYKNVYFITDTYESLL
jgi:rhodanese-related sulfurtransferase